MEPTKRDYLIVGGGLAGLFFAHELEQAGKSFLIIDAANENAASNLAAGMFGPLGGKLNKLAWKAPEMLEKLAQKANELETKLQQKFIHWMPVQVAFGNTKDANDYACRELSPILNEHLSDIIQGDAHVKAPFACFEMQKSGWFNTTLFLKSYRSYLSNIDNYKQETFNYLNLVQTETDWQYQGICFKKSSIC